MAGHFDGKLFCERLPREIRDQIYKHVWITEGDIPWASGRATYLELMHGPLFYMNYLPEVLITPVRETDDQVATELVSWLYEHIDLGICCLGEYGVFFEEVCPELVCDQPEVELPKLSIQDLEKVLHTDVFGVGITPADCKLRALTILAEYDAERGSDFMGIKARPEPFAHLEALPGILAAQPKTPKFQLTIVTVAWRCNRYPDAPLVNELQNLFNHICVALVRKGVKVLPTYLDYDQHVEYWVEGGGRLRSNEKYQMNMAIGAENLPVPEGYYEDADIKPQFIKWEDAFDRKTHLRIEYPGFL